MSLVAEGGQLADELGHQGEVTGGERRRTDDVDVLGTTAVLPKINLTFMATGGAGALIETKFAGTSYNNPGLTFTVTVTGTPIGNVSTTSNCFASVNPILSTTEIG